MNTHLIVKIKKINDKAIIPKYQTDGSAGFDFHAVIDIDNKYYRTENYTITIPPKSQTLIHTGLCMSIPYGYELQVRPRSGLALKQSITVTNSPGTIDSDWRGEIGVILINLGNELFIIHECDRIAQGVINKIDQVQFEVVDELDETIRGSNGYGSTGKS